MIIEEKWSRDHNEAVELVLGEQLRRGADLLRGNLILLPNRQLRGVIMLDDDDAIEELTNFLQLALAEGTLLRFALRTIKR